MREDETVATTPTEELIPSPSWGDRLEGIEGLRGLAAVSVLITHVRELMHPDAVGVIFTLADRGRHGLTLFFVLSGFLLWRPFAAALLVGKRPPSGARFLRNRGLRIFPAYLVVLLLASLVLGAVQLSSLQFDGRDTTTASTMGVTDTLVSLTFLQTLIPQFTLTGIQPAWSLTTELTFYLLLPVMFMAAATLAKRLPRLTAALVPAGLLVAIGLTGKTWMVMAAPDDASKPAVRFAFAWGHEWSAVVCRSILVHGDLFGYGMAAAVVYVMLENGRWVVHRRALALALAAGIVVACVVIAVLALVPRYFTDSVMGVGCCVLLLAVLLRRSAGRPSAVAAALESVPLRFVGLVSYSVYLWHLPVISWLQKHGWQAHGGTAAFALNVALLLGLVLPLATVTYLIVERPALQMKARVRQG
nr:acyltransferase [Nocardioides ginsengisegetis]